MKRSSACLLAVLTSLQVNSCAFIPFSEEILGGEEQGEAESSDPVAEDPEATVPPVVCGSHTCEAFKMIGLFDLSPCCPADSPSTCGSSVSAVLGSMLGIPPGCYALEAPGTADATCPDLEFTSATGEPAVWPGCRGPNGACGALVDATSASGPDLGCVLP